LAKNFFCGEGHVSKYTISGFHGPQDQCEWSQYDLCKIATVGNLPFTSQVQCFLHLHQVVHDETQNISEVNLSRLSDSCVSVAEDLQGTGAPQDVVSCSQKCNQ
jgi:hypothetical protein